MAATQPDLNQVQTQAQPQFQPTQDNEKPKLDYYYPNFVGTSVSGVDPKEKSFETSNGKVQYKEIPIQYNYGTPESPIIDSLFFELPEVSSFGGIVEKRESKPGLKEGDPAYMKESYSMMFSFNLQDQECAACLKKFDEMHKGTCYALAKHKGRVGMPSFNPEFPGEIYKHPIYYKIDPVTCERVAGKNPSLWVKLNSYKNNKTLFTDLEENIIDWSLLKDVEVKMIPLLHVEKIYIGGGKASLQIKLVSAVITDIAPINTKTKQTATIDRLKQRKGLAENVAAQLASMRMERQDALDGGQIRPQAAKLPPSDQNGVGTMHQIPASSNYQGTQESLNAYLGGAPAMNQSPPSMTPNALPQVQLPTANPPSQAFQTPNQSHTQAQPVQLNVRPQFSNQPALQIQ